MSSFDPPRAFPPPLLTKPLKNDGPSLFEVQQRHVQAEPFMFAESCIAKGCVSALIGGGMGGLMGLFLGSYRSISPPLSMPGVPEPPSIPLKYQMRESYMHTARSCRRWGRNFMMVTAVFSGVECVIEKYRAKHDIVNGVTAGCATGAALAASGGVGAMCFGCAGFAAFSYVIESVMGTH